MDKKRSPFIQKHHKVFFITYYSFIFLGCCILAYALFVSFRRPSFLYKANSSSNNSKTEISTPLTDEGKNISNQKISVNTATLSQLQLLPTIGSVTAQEIIMSRENLGPFHYPEDLLAVKGIGEKTLEKIRPYLAFD